MNVDRPIRFRLPQLKTVEPSRLITPESAIVGDDGGLKRRQVLRDVKARMKDAKFRMNKLRIMHCGECLIQKARNVREYRTWDSLRDHLISHHKIDHREVPE